MNRKYIFLVEFLLLVAMVVLTSCIQMRESSQEAEVDNQLYIAPKIETRFGIEIEGYEIASAKIKSGETMGQIMMRNGRSALDVDRLDRLSRNRFPLRNIRAGRRYTTFMTKDTMGYDRVDYVVYEVDELNYVVFMMLPDTMAIYEGVKPSTVRLREGSAVINNSLWGAIMERDMPYAVAAEMESIYQWSVDFFGIQKGDSFSVIYEERFVDDTVSVGVGAIKGVKFTHGKYDHYAIPFSQTKRADSTDVVEFWDENGGSLRKQMLKAPLKYSRISSRFSNARLHPIYKVYRPHHGVDYAAPSGTPVYAVADGVVIIKGWNSGGGGNWLKIKHPNDLMTAYLHLSGFAKGVVQGSHVKQGDLIGYVGSTGASTGPHLDYRVYKRGVAIDPLKIPQSPSKPIDTAHLEAFKRLRDSLVARLDSIAVVE